MQNDSACQRLKEFFTVHYAAGAKMSFEPLLFNIVSLDCKSLPKTDESIVTVRGENSKELQIGIESNSVGKSTLSSTTANISTSNFFNTKCIQEKQDCIVFQSTNDWTPKMLCATETIAFHGKSISAECQKVRETMEKMNDNK
mgnify:CR=1 FL=1